MDGLTVDDQLDSVDFALAAYRALGYHEHSHFEERLVHRRSSLWDSIVGPVRAYLSDLRRNG